jgi:uncharacterized pyridoxal phosphate-containing UPF0001 family protein
MKLDSIADRLEHVKEEVFAAAEQSGRSGDDITLIAVSKGVEASRVEEAIACGHLDFGENRAQEAAQKHRDLVDRSVRWHFVGRLQRNKVKLVAEFVYMVHSVDRYELAEEIHRRAEAATREGGSGGVAAPRGQDRTLGALEAAIPLKKRVLIEVNTSGEEAKGGVSPAQLPGLVEQVATLDRLQITGLMTMAPVVEDAEAARPCFRSLAQLRDDMQDRFPNAGIQHLSMGMSQDYVVAIEEGATLVRIGQAIFGRRVPRLANPSGRSANPSG